MLAFMLVFFVISIQFFACFGAAKSLPEIGRHRIMRVIVYGSTYDMNSATVSARISIMDTEDSEVAVIERSWKGSTLFIDFVGADFLGRKVYFPYTVRSDARKKGTLLERYYMEHGRCYLAGDNITEKEQKSFYYLGRYALGQAKRIFTAFTRLYTIDLSQCLSGRYYSVYTGMDGLPQLVAE